MSYGIKEMSGIGVAESRADPQKFSAPPPPHASSRGPTGASPEKVAPGKEVGMVFEVGGRSGGDLVIKIVDRQTQRVLREIPPEEVQRMRSTMQSILGLALHRQG